GAHPAAAAAATAGGGRAARRPRAARGRHAQGHDRKAHARRSRARAAAPPGGAQVTTLLLALVCAGVGFAAGYWYVAPRRQVNASLARRSRVLYELAEGDLENVAAELEAIAEAEPADSTAFLALAALDRRRGRVERAKAI